MNGGNSNIQAISAGVMLFFYFLIMDQSGHSTELWLRSFNVLILLVMIGLPLIKMNDDEGIRYFPGLQKGIHITIASSVIFGFALWIYLASGISNFMPAMQEMSQLPEGVGALQVAMVAFFETLATGVIISFVLMQVMKRKIGKSRKERSETVHA